MREAENLEMREEALWGSYDFCRTSFSLFSSGFVFLLSSSRMSMKFPLGEVGCPHTGRGLNKPPGSLQGWEAGQVDCAHTAAFEILEDRFISCQIPFALPFPCHYS